MADISKIQIENGTYNIKDETARNNLTIILNQKNKYNSIPNFFGMINEKLISSVGAKCIEPIIVYDEETSKYLMFYSECTSSYYIKRAESGNLRNWSIASGNILGSATNRHKLSILVDVYGNPVKINNKYHGYVVSGEPKHIYLIETTSLTSNWTETGVVLSPGTEGTTDSYGCDAPCAIYDEVNNKILLFYMAVPNSAPFGSKINRCESDSPTGTFTYEATILSPTANTWYSGWLGGIQILKTESGIRVLFNGSPTTPSYHGAEPDPSAIGLGSMDTLYSNIIPPIDPILRLNSNIPNTINVGSIWRGYLIFNKFINKFEIFYNTGAVGGDEYITYAAANNYFYSSGAATTYRLNDTNETLIPGSLYFINYSNYRFIINTRCAIGSGTGMKVFKIRLRLSTNDTLSVDANDVVIAERDIFIGNYAYQNENAYVYADALMDSYYFKKVYATIQIVEGDASNDPHFENIEFTANVI